MGGIFIAWLIAEGIVVYRTVKVSGGPPMPAQLLATTGLYAALSLVASNERTRFLGQAGAWGFTAAAWLALYTNPPKVHEQGHAPGKPVTASPTVAPPATGNPIRQV